MQVPATDFATRITCNYCNQVVAEGDMDVHLCHEMPRRIWNFQNIEVVHRRKVRKEKRCRVIFRTLYLLVALVSVLGAVCTHEYEKYLLFGALVTAVTMLVHLLVLED
ncbi:hypothetical protein A2419_03235 [Candidatus Adlerbacteria bacterium RIFOXYC1_FULL_48_26]|uniref:Uncharacterized protein n=1 Tax=Candidatus Adlerbacteria bacterium RIFOXYC1_FULL_48_26 TaxID=1797247 RepID=A0A1F4Y4G9_9BACT|nr:MAG: hypothetical protein A2419_03235 [Candidatus Adlerbacteria bacterium RIFOXYC1_FULL_48_26]OGC94524.1 MAG: hypothetical protein A2389_01395 [Candidatus Adlerbacteria bacterium RIFOXYB1_FULL_48_10]OGC96194.1 MAG: hypothetical protein A2590_01015 [Candidatus Adlerbacteria bacterium RIFOXYD1_FULL_48_8]